MKKSIRILSGAAALALALCVMAPTALAEDVTMGGLTIGTSNAEPSSSPLPTQEPTITPAPTQEPAASPAPTPYSSQGVYVVAATVTDAAGGEVPTVAWYDKVNVVLRVVDHSSAKYNVDAGDISARVNSSVFTYTGNGEISQLVEGDDDEGHYYSYVLLFRDVIYNGGGDTFPINLSYLDSSLPMQQFSVTLGQCVDKDPLDPTKVRTPSLVVRESSYGNAAVVAGTPFGLTLTVYATAGTESLNDVITSVTLPDGITLTGGSLSNYVGTMSAKSTRDVSFTIQPSASYTTGVANITVNMTGTGAVTGSATTGTTVISVPISQPDRFELGKLELPDTVYVGQAATVTLNFVNKGKNPLSNVEGTLTGSDLGADATNQYIGTLNAGAENSVDFDLTPTTPGTLNGSINLSYEAHDGGIKTVSKDFSISVMDAPVMEMDPSMGGMIEEPQQQGFPIWGWVLVAVGAVVVIVIIVLVVRKRRKAAALAKLEESEDEAI